MSYFNLLVLALLYFETMDPAPEEVCDSWWMASYSFSKQEQPAWLFLGLQLGLLMSDMKRCLWARRPWDIVTLILNNPAKSGAVVSEKSALSSSMPTWEMIPAVLPVVKTGRALKCSQNITANCFHVLGKMQVFSAWSACASISVMMSMYPFQWMLLLTRNPSKPILLSLGLYKMCRGSKEKQRAQTHSWAFVSKLSHGHSGLKLPT